jgi:hypothetical protein
MARLPRYMRFDGYEKKDKRLYMNITIKWWYVPILFIKTLFKALKSAIEFEANLKKIKYLINK